jgi:uncharacterized protein with HEPN domain
VKDDCFYLVYILDSISRIQTYTEGGSDAFFSDTMVSDAVLRVLQTLGESAKQVSAGVKQAAPEIEWREIIAFRNVLVHDYLGVDLARVWQIVGTLPQLKKQIETLRERLPKQA